MKFYSFILPGLISMLLLMGALRAESSVNQLVPSGDLRLLSGLVVDNYGSLVNSKGSETKITDLSTGKNFTVNYGLNASVVARTANFDRVLVRGGGDEGHILYLLNSKGDLLKKIKFDSQMYAEYNLIEGDIQFSIDDTGKTILFASQRIIGSYSLVTNKWEIIDSIKPGELIYGWFQSNGTVVNAIFDEDIIIYKNSPYKKNKNEYAFSIYNWKLKKKVGDFYSAAFISQKLSSHYIAMMEKNSVRIVNLKNAEELMIPLASSDFVSPFQGPRNLLGLVYQARGKILLYSIKGELVKTIDLPPIKEFKPLPGSPNILLQFEDNEGKQLFRFLNLESEQSVPWPDLLQVAMNRFRTHYLRVERKGKEPLEKIYLKLSEEVSLHPISFELNFSMEPYVQNNSFYNVKSNLVIPISTLLGLEGKLISFDRESLIKSIHQSRQALDEDSVRASIWMIEEHIKNQVVKNDQWRWYMSLISPSLQKLSMADKDFYLDEIAIKIIERQRDENSLQEVPMSKLVNIVIDSLKPFFGLKSLGKSDFTLIQNDRTAQPLIMGSQIIDHDESTNKGYGLYIKKLPIQELETDKYRDFEYHWTHGQNDWSAKVKAQLVNLSHYAHRENSINYSNLWKDNKLTGAIVISSNLQDGFISLAKKMVDYYRGEGFSFGMVTVKAPETSPNFWHKMSHLFLFPVNAPEIKDGKTWLQEKIESGEIDYLVKEAHSGGGDEVMWLAKKSILLRGIKKMKNNRSEVIYILVPTEIDPLLGGREVAVRDNEFGEWIRKREQKNGRELIYINGSCWSTARAKQELIAARSSLLHEIPTKSTVLTFSNSEQNHERMLIHLIRQGKSYPEIQDRLEMISSPKNPFIFQNDTNFEQSIWSTLNLALDFSVKLAH